MNIEKSWGVYSWLERRYWVDWNIFLPEKEANRLNIKKFRTITEGFVEVDLILKKLNEGNYILSFQFGGGSHLLSYRVRIKKGKFLNSLLRRVFRYGFQKNNVLQTRLLLCVHHVFPDKYFFIFRLIKKQEVVEFVLKPSSVAEALAWFDLTNTRQILKDVYWLEGNDLGWEVHHYHDSANYRLVVAKFILKKEQSIFTSPPPLWVDSEITNDIRFLEHELSIFPHSKWRTSFLRKLNTT